MDKKTKQMTTVGAGIILVIGLLYFFILPSMTGEGFGFRWSNVFERASVGTGVSTYTPSICSTPIANISTTANALFIPGEGVTATGNNNEQTYLDTLTLAVDAVTGASYRFACDGENFGPWESSITANCRYEAAGSYAAMVEVKADCGSVGADAVAITAFEVTPDETTGNNNTQAVSIALPYVVDGAWNVWSVPISGTAIPVDTWIGTSDDLIPLGDWGVVDAIPYDVLD